MDVEFIFGRLNIKRDITYYKYKVINGVKMGFEEFED